MTSFLACVLRARSNTFVAAPIKSAVSVAMISITTIISISVNAAGFRLLNKFIFSFALVNTGQGQGSVFAKPPLLKLRRARGYGATGQGRERNPECRGRRPEGSQQGSAGERGGSRDPEAGARSVIQRKRAGSSPRRVRPVADMEGERKECDR